MMGQCAHRDQFSTRCTTAAMKGKPMCYNHMQQVKPRRMKPINRADIRRRVRAGETKMAVAADLGCSRQFVQTVCRG